MGRARRGPIHSMLMGAAGTKALRFHMPGHKGLIRLPGASLDLTELPNTDTLLEPTGAILQACEDAARCWHSGHSFLLVNGSTAGIQTMLLWAAMQGRAVLLPRDCHSAAVYACAVAGIQPTWLDPAWHAGEQMNVWQPVYLSQMPGGKSALFLTYPDYYGRCINITGIQAQTAGCDVKLLIDAAHGSHFAFSNLLPADAGTVADAWVAGAHKTLPAPTQTAFLHVRDSRDAPDFARMLRGVTTTSPSFLLMAGLDNSRVFMEGSGDRLDALVSQCHALAARLNRLPGVRCWRKADAVAMGYADHDATRLVVDVRGLGMSGWEAGARLRAYGVEPEMCDIARIVLIATVMDDQARLDRLYAAFERLAMEKKQKPFAGGVASLPVRGPAAMTLRQAWLSPAIELPLEHAAGRVASEPFGAYPPGIPLCMPGEVIPADAIALIREVQALGGGVFGVRQGMVPVVEE